MAQTDRPQPRLDARGAVDLSALARPATPPPGAPGGLPAPGPYAVDVDEASFPALVQSSTSHPVVVVLWAPWSQVSRDVVADLGALADEDAGTWQLARIDSEANPQIAAAFQAQSVPLVAAILAGQPVPLFQGGAPRDQMRPVIDQVLAAAAANGLTARVEPAQPAPETAEPEPELPPCTRRRTTRSSATTWTRRVRRTSRRCVRTPATTTRVRDSPRSGCSPGRATPTCRACGRRPPPDPTTSLRSWRSRTSTCSAARWPMRSTAWSTCCAGPPAPTRSRCGSA